MAPYFQLPTLEVKRISNSSITQLSTLMVPAWDFQHPNSLQTSKCILRRNQFKGKSKNLAETQNLHCSVNLIYTACSLRTNLVPRGKLESSQTFIYQHLTRIRPFSFSWDPFVHISVYSIVSLQRKRYTVLHHTLPVSSEVNATGKSTRCFVAVDWKAEHRCRHISQQSYSTLAIYFQIEAAIYI